MLRVNQEHWNYNPILCLSLKMIQNTSEKLSLSLVYSISLLSFILTTDPFVSLFPLSQGRLIPHYSCTSLLKFFLSTVHLLNFIPAVHPFFDFPSNLNRFIFFPCISVLKFSISIFPVFFPHRWSFILPFLFKPKRVHFFPRRWFFLFSFPWNRSRAVYSSFF